MARWWRYLLMVAVGIAAVAPVRLHVDLRPRADLQLAPAAALAEASDGGGNGGGNGNGAGNGNSGSKGNSGNGNGNAAGNSGNGAAGGGNGNGNSGGQGNSGGNSGAGSKGGGANNGGGAASGGGSAGSASGGNDVGSSSSSRGDAPGRSGEAPGHSRNASGQSAKGSGFAREQNPWSDYEVRPVRSGIGRSSKPTTRSQNMAVGKQGKASVAGSNGQPRKGIASRASKTDSGVREQGTSSLSSGSRAAHSTRSSAGMSAVPTITREWEEPIGSRAKPQQAPNSILASGLSEQDLAKLAASGLRITSQTRGVFAPRVIRLRLPGGMSIADARRVVQRINLQASADRDTYYYTDAGASGCVAPGCEASVLVGWTMVGTDDCRTPPLIGLIDTGIDLGHEALRGQAIELLNVSKESGSNSSLDHGTAIAALLVGRTGSATPGLMPRARLIAVDAFSKAAGTADRADVVSLVSALEALADRGVKVVNLSLSGPPNEVLRKAVEAARANGMVLVAAAGNNGAGAEPSYPAAYPGVIAVTAVDRQLNVYRRATRGPYVAFSAPGVEIQTAQSNGVSAAKSGTSYAVPFVSAAMALMQVSQPESDIEQLQKRLQDSTRDLGAPGRDPTFGYGLVQMANLCSAPRETLSVPVAHRAPPAALLQQDGSEAP